MFVFSWPSTFDLLSVVRLGEHSRRSWRTWWRGSHTRWRNTTLRRLASSLGVFRVHSPGCLVRTDVGLPVRVTSVTPDNNLWISLWLLQGFRSFDTIPSSTPTEAEVLVPKPTSRGDCHTTFSITRLTGSGAHDQLCRVWCVPTFPGRRRVSSHGLGGSEGRDSPGFYSGQDKTIPSFRETSDVTHFRAPSSRVSWMSPTVTGARTEGWRSQTDNHGFMKEVDGLE